MHLYYDMKLVTFGTDDNSNLIIQFPVFVQPYSQSLLTLNQIETVSVPIIDHNTGDNSYNESDFYCEELFIVKHKSRYSYKTAFLIYPKTSLKTVVLLIIILITHLPSL